MLSQTFLLAVEIYDLEMLPILRTLNFQIRILGRISGKEHS